MSFSVDVRNKSAALWQRSFEHAFIRELAAGILPDDKFSHYVLNDSCYLTTFAKVQAIAASKSSDLDVIGRMAFHAESTVKAEHALHETFFGMLGIKKNASFIPSPTAYKYTSHLLATAATGSLADIMASILPCYWLYWEIGQRYRHAKPNHPIYDKWIEAYGGEWFGELVQEQIQRMDQLAENVTEVQRNRLEQLFLISSQYELEFWDMAYNLESWSFVS